MPRIGCFDVYKSRIIIYPYYANSVRAGEHKTTSQVINKSSLKTTNKYGLAVRMDSKKA